MVPRSCSQCGNNGHNSRTCGESPAGGDQSSSTGFMLFGVRVTEAAAAFRKSFSMNNLSQYDEQPPEEPNADVAAGYESDDVVHASGRSRERKRGVPWTEEEHKLFLLGLQKVGKGDWRGISRNFVKTRTPTQVASHAQKYFLRRNSQNRRRRRSSLFDITTDTFMSSSMEEDQVYQETATPALPQLQPCLNSNRPGGFPMSTFPVTVISPVISPVRGDNPLEKLTSGPTNVNKKSPKLVRPVPIAPIPPSSKMADLNLNQKSPKDQFPALSLKLSTPSSSSEEQQQQPPPASTHSPTFQAISSSDNIISVA